MLLLHDVLALSNHLPKLAPLLVKLVDSCLARVARRPQEEYASSYVNSAWVIGACLECLATRPADEWTGPADTLGWVRTIVDKWGWSSVALNGLVSTVRARSVVRLFTTPRVLTPVVSDLPSQAIPFDNLYAHLQPSLLSHSRPLRLACLRLLSSNVVRIDNSTSDVVGRCLHAEEIPLDVQGSRERVLRITRLPVAVTKHDDCGAEIAARWLIGAYVWPL